MENVLFITGSNGGIGSEISNYFKKKNWIVIGTDIQENTNNVNLDKYYSVNLVNPEEVAYMLIDITSEYKNISCFIHCAGYQLCKPIWEYTIEEWDNTYNCNVRACFLIVKYGIDIFKLSKTNIINISSIHSIATSKNISSYASSKAALTGLTKNLAIDLSEFGIRVNSISPGAINTRMLTNHLNETQLNNLKNTHLLKKIGEPEQIAQACMFINNNHFMNGNNLIIDGGVSCQLASE
jgi:NAD(P)-dependent dehydrogenase (short-subunit alcohol dehydrogenase family)